PRALKTSTTPLSRANSPHKRISAPSVTPGMARASTPSTTLSTPCNNTNHQFWLSVLTSVSMIFLLPTCLPALHLSILCHRLAADHDHIPHLPTYNPTYCNYVTGTEPAGARCPVLASGSPRSRRAPGPSP